jgi:hypothetical protein
VKLTFEGNNLLEITTQMRSFLADELYTARTYPSRPPEGPSPEVENSDPTAAEAFAEAPTPPVVEDAEKAKRKAMMQERAAKMRAAKDAKKAAAEAAPAPEPAPAPPPPITPKKAADAVQLRQRTLSELQSAYANGKHAEVLELLSRFGNGAKSFRELPPDAFVPIREAIDLGALT